MTQTAPTPVMPHNSLKEMRSYKALQSHVEQAKQWQLLDLFAADQQRFSRFSVEGAGLFLDYSKNRVDDTTIQLLVDLARECGVEMRRAAMFAGEKINTTEHRAALHVALRMPSTAKVTVDGQDV